MADSHTKSKRVSYQPLHPSVRWKLEKAYVQYHDTYFQYLKPDTEWNPGWRTAPSRFASTSSKPVKVGSVIDLKLGKFSVRIYSSTQGDGKFTSKSGGLCRRFWRHFSLDAKINPGHSLYQILVWRRFEPHMICFTQPRWAFPEIEF